MIETNAGLHHLSAIVRRRFISLLRRRREQLRDANLLRAYRALAREEVEEQIEQGEAIGEGTL